MVAACPLVSLSCPFTCLSISVVEVFRTRSFTALTLLHKKHLGVHFCQDVFTFFTPFWLYIPHFEFSSSGNMYWRGGCCSFCGLTVSRSSILLFCQVSPAGSDSDCHAIDHHDNFYGHYYNSSFQCGNCIDCGSYEYYHCDWTSGYIPYDGYSYNCKMESLCSSSY